MSKPTYFIDSSSLKLLPCWRHFYNRVVLGLTGESDRHYKMAYGSAIHKFTEAYYKGLPQTECLKIALDYYKPYAESISDSPYEFRTTSHVIKVCREYSIRFPRVSQIQTDGSRIFVPTDFQPLFNSYGEKAIEFKFVRPWKSTDKFDLMLCGTVDLVCSYAGHDLLLVDYKFTGTQQSKAEEFLDGYSFDIQPMFYSLMFKDELGLSNYPPVLIRGGFCKKPTIKSENAGVFDGVMFKDSPIMSWSNSQMEEFRHWLYTQLELIEKKIYYPELFKNDYNPGACKTVFGKCQYFSACSLAPEHREGKLQQFKVDRYEPLKFRD